MSYVSTGMRPVDFSVCQYGQSRFLLRGKRVRTDRPYWVSIGGANTYAEDIVTPFTTQLERHFKVPIINMGIAHSGPDAVMADSDLMALVARAERVIIEAPSCVNHSNRYYKVHPRRNDRFIRPMPDLVRLYPEIDFTDCHFTKHLLCKLLLCDQERFQIIQDDLQNSWMDKMRTLIAWAGGAILWSAPRGRQTNEIDDLLGVTPSDLAQLGQHVTFTQPLGHRGTGLSQQAHDLIGQKLVQMLDDAAMRGQ